MALSVSIRGELDLGWKKAADYIHERSGGDQKRGGSQTARGSGNCDVLSEYGSGGGRKANRENNGREVWRGKGQGKGRVVCSFRTKGPKEKNFACKFLEVVVGQNKRAITLAVVA